MPWLTPDDAPADATCRRIFIPDSEAWRAIISGALVPLMNTANWEQHGTATPEECAARAQEMILQFFDDNCPEPPGEPTLIERIGEVKTWLGTEVPENWLAFGGVYSVPAYPELVAILPTEWVAGDFFQLPDLSGAAMFASNTPGLSIDDSRFLEGGASFGTVNVPLYVVAKQPTP